MSTVFGFNQERRLEGFAMIVLGVVITMLAAITLSGENASAGIGHATTQMSQVSTTHGVGITGLILFGDSNLKGLLK